MMPAKKRTDQTKRTPPTLPTTSTSHASTDQHHRLRHTGPSISARPGVAAAPPKLPSAHPEHTPEILPTQEGTHDKKLLTEVSHPGARTSLTKFLYALLFMLLLLSGWYIYGMIVLLERLREEVGWWGIITGDPRGTVRWETFDEWGFGSKWPARQGGLPEMGKDGDLEGALNALADILGISPMQVASAVKPLVPHASLTSVASRSTGGSEAVRILFEDTLRSDRDSAESTQVVQEFAL